MGAIPAANEGVDLSDRPSDNLYLLESGGLFKIGRTRNIRSRLSSLRTGSPYGTHAVAVIPCEDAPKQEKHWHSRFAGKRVRGEWFRLTAQDVKTFLSESNERLLSEREARIGELTAQVERLDAALRREQENLQREQQLRLLAAPQEPPTPEPPAEAARGDTPARPWWRFWER